MQQTMQTLNKQLTNKQISPQTKLIITDVDGTLSSFWDYFVPAMRDFLKELSPRVDIPVFDLARDIGHVIERRGTHEYPWLLEETSFAWKHFGDRPDEFIEDFVKPFWTALDNNRAKYLRPFPTVLDTLQELKEKGIKIVALSDAPEYMARIRNRQIFDGLLDAIYALETVEPDVDDVFQPIALEHGRDRVKLVRTQCADLKTPLFVLPKDFEKPCPAGLDRVLKDFDVYPQETIFIGDSLAKDGQVAASRGIRYLWAHYGYQLPAEYEELINFSLKPESLIAAQKQLPVELITAVAARYDELLNHV
jgi:FMN phosphatase YigB (HAD superfamily)